MGNETSPDIIIQPTVKNMPDSDTVRSLIQEVHSQELELLSTLESKEKKAQLDFTRMSNFIGIEIDSSKVFIIPRSKKGKVVGRGINGDTGDGFHNLSGEYMVVYFSEAETIESVEEKVVHEYFHHVGLKNIVVLPSNAGDNNSIDVSSRRIGFALLQETSAGTEGTYKPGLLLEEMAASYAGLAYLRKYASEKYWDQVEEALRADNIDSISKQLGKKYILLNSELNPIPLNSLCAFLFDMLRYKLDLGIGVNPHDVVKAAIEYRKNSASIRRFIKKLEQSLGKGSYKTLRKIVPGESSIQEAIDLILH